MRLTDSDRWRAVVTAPTDQLLRRYAALVAGVLREVAPVLAVGHAAADADPDLIEPRDRGHAAEYATHEALVKTLHARRVLARHLDVAQATDIAYALAGHAVYLRLVVERGWSGDAYVAWLAATLEDALLVADREPAARTAAHVVRRPRPSIP